MTCSNQLVSAPVEVPDRRRQHVNEPGKGKDEKDCQTEKQVCFKDGVYVSDKVSRPAMKCQYPLRPLHELDHFVAI